MAEGDLNVIGTTPKPKQRLDKKLLISLLGVLVVAVGAIAGIFLVSQQQDIREDAAIAMCPAQEQCPVVGEPNHLWSCSPGESDGSVNDQICNRAGKSGVCGGVQYCCPSVGGAWTTDMSLCPVATPTIGPVVTATAVPTSAPTEEPTAEPTTDPVSTPTITPTPDPTANPQCNSACSDNGGCPTQFICYIPTGQTTGNCRSAQCLSQISCTCATIAPVATATATSLGNSTESPSAGPTTIAVAQSQPTSSIFPVPETGASFPTLFGLGVGVIVILLSFSLVL